MDEDAEDYVTPSFGPPCVLNDIACELQNIENALLIFSRS